MARVIIDLRPLDLSHPNAPATNAHNLASALLRRGDHEYLVLEPGSTGPPPGADVNLLPGGGKPRFGIRNLVLIPELDHLLDRGGGPLKLMIRSWRTALTASRADVLLAPSQTIREALISYLRTPANRIAINPPGLEPGFERTSQGMAGAARSRLGLPERYLLLFGTPARAVDEAWEGVGSERGETRLVRASDLGNLTREELRAVLSGALACLYAARGNGLPLGPLEAMACGSPPLVIGDAAYPEVVRDGGLVIRPDHEVQDWKESMGALLRSRKLRMDLSNQSRRLAAVFTADRSANLVAPLLNPAVEEGVDPR